MKKTKFYFLHERLGAKIVDFAGFKMPIQYTSILNEHKAVRNSVGVFDVSHMGEIFILGKDAAKVAQYITVNDVSKLTPGRVQYSAMCYENGGIVDDLLVYKFNDEKFMFVVNASNKDRDFEWIKKNNKFDAQIVDESDEYSLLAVQGPNSKKVLDKVVDKPFELEYYWFTETSIQGINCILSRTGYTGELGYEAYFKGDENTAERIWNSIFEAGKEFNIVPVGLGARDTLRLEMGFCLYGNDIDETTNPLEANLGWITKLNKGDFIGKEALLKAKENGIKRKLMPLIMSGSEKIIPRKGYEIVDEKGNKIGVVTSGALSPILDKPIAIAYIETEAIEKNANLYFNIRNSKYSAQATKLPFISKQ